MFIESQPPDQIQHYKRLLNAVGALSKLFSESPEPYLASRATESIFCRAFEAINHSRSDASADASKDRVGFGIKTFLDKNGKTLQKIAEFNSDHIMFNTLGPKEKILRIAELRNERIETTKRIYSLDQLLYHCITRKTGKILVFETPFQLINLDSIKVSNTSSETKNTIRFSDGKADYSFNTSKSTLYQRFITPNKVSLEIPVRILTDPFNQIEKLIAESGLIFAPVKNQPRVFLPLYSTKKGKKIVPVKSGLNLWNASGRPRGADEAYINIPAWIHKSFKNFFPARETAFDLTLPNQMVMNAKVCQDNSKALMSNPNGALGKWILRDVLNLKPMELLTYDKLEAIGLDAVVVYKISHDCYDIDFAKIGSYETFKQENTDNLVEDE